MRKDWVIKLKYRLLAQVGMNVIKTFSSVNINNFVVGLSSNLFTALSVNYFVSNTHS